MYFVPHLIHGERVARAHKTLPLYNPAFGAPIGEVMMADSAVVQEAVQSAASALPDWARLPALKRARVLFKLKYLLETHLDELAQLITQEHGKTLNDARGSIQRGIDVVEFACGIQGYLQGKYAENISAEVDGYSVRQPLGVCVGITPFNFPAMIALWMFPIAIACGNTFIIKPSEKDPSCSLRIAELCIEAGVPPGVVNVVQGDQETVEALLQHPEVRAVSFVGSTAVAEKIFRTATAQLKRVQAFGGAKNHCVIMPDADIEQAADALVSAGYGSAGERCMAISVCVAVGDAVADALVARMRPKIEQLKIGPGDQAGVEVGPLISQAHLARVQDYVQQGVDEGAELVVDGRQYKPQGCERGFFMGGCLFDRVEKTMRIYREEIFGPVLGVIRVRDLDEAIALINAHEYGNGAAIFTGDGEAARTFAAKVQAGMVGVNVPIPVPMAYFSFGGWKHSNFADLHMHGPEGVQFYTKLKTVTQRWPRSTTAPSFAIPTTR